jgi:hypothetical protein
MYQIQSNSIGKMILEIEIMHCALCCKRLSRLTHLRAAQLENRASFTRARPAKKPGPLPLAHGPTGARARGRGNLGPGRAFAPPPGPKEAHSRVGRSQPLDQDQRLRVDFGQTKPPEPFNPKTLAPFLIPPFASAFFFLSPSERASGGRRRPSGRRHGEPPRRRARPPQGGRVAVEWFLRGALIWHARAAQQWPAWPLSARGRSARRIRSVCRRPKHTDSGRRKR